MADRTGIKDGTLAVLIKLAERPQGVTGKEGARATGKHSDRCTQFLYVATKRGRLHKAGPHMHSRWFVHPEHAAAYERQCAAAVPTVRVNVRTPTEHTKRMHQASLGQHNRERAAVRDDTPPIITSATRVTIAPPPRSRYQVDEAPRVVDSQQCRPWAKEAVR
jgi:hypothetical protein